MQGDELTMMMGRPARYTPKEIETAVLRGRYMCSIAQRELSVVDAEAGNTPVHGVKRFIKKEPLGLVLAISGIPPQSHSPSVLNHISIPFFMAVLTSSLELSLVPLPPGRPF